MEPTTSDESEYDEHFYTSLNLLANDAVNTGAYKLLSKPGEWPVLGIAE